MSNREQNHRAREAVGLCVSELETLIAVMAHETAMGSPVHSSELREFFGRQPPVTALVRGRWLRRIQQRDPQYFATDRAWRELALQGPCHGR